MADESIITRLSFNSGDEVYLQLIDLKGNSTAIRRRLHTLIHLGLMAEASLKGQTTGHQPTTAPSVGMDLAAAGHSKNVPSTKKSKRALEKISFSGLDDPT